MARSLVFSLLKSAQHFHRQNKELKEIYPSVGDKMSGNLIRRFLSLEDSTQR